MESIKEANWAEKTINKALSSIESGIDQLKKVSLKNKQHMEWYHEDLRELITKYRFFLTFGLIGEEKGLYEYENYMKEKIDFSESMERPYLNYSTGVSLIQTGIMILSNSIEEMEHKDSWLYDSLRILEDRWDVFLETTSGMDNLERMATNYKDDVERIIKLV